MMVRYWREYFQSRRSALHQFGKVLTAFERSGLQKERIIAERGILAETSCSDVNFGSNLGNLQEPRFRQSSWHFTKVDRDGPKCNPRPDLPSFVGFLEWSNT